MVEHRSPLGTIFPRFSSLVGDLIRLLDKKITLHMTGAEIEVDSSLLPPLYDSLCQLIRHTVIHHIETPEERRRAGKLEYGVIRLQAFTQEGNVIIEVADDGRGLEFRVSDGSHHKIGLDVVKENIDALGGAVSVTSEPGCGTCFRLTLPLTPAVFDGLLLREGEGIYILPLTGVVEFIRPRPEQLKTAPDQSEVVVTQDEVFPLLRLGRLWKGSVPLTDVSQRVVVIVKHATQQLALVVDEVVGQQTVGIKSLKTIFQDLDGIAGAAILKDGSVGVVLHVPGLFALAPD